MKPRKRIQSKKLYEYLLELEVLDRGEDAITEAKKKYRKEYKRAWAENRKKLSKEISFFISLRQHQKLRILAMNNQVAVSRYCKELILDSIHGGAEVKNRILFKRILQIISLSINENSIRRLEELERFLIDQLTHGDHKSADKA